MEWHSPLGRSETTTRRSLLAVLVLVSAIIVSWWAAGTSSRPPETTTSDRSTRAANDPQAALGMDRQTQQATDAVIPAVTDSAREEDVEVHCLWSETQRPAAGSTWRLSNADESQSSIVTASDAGVFFVTRAAWRLESLEPEVEAAPSLVDPDGPRVQTMWVTKLLAAEIQVHDPRGRGIASARVSWRRPSAYRPDDPWSADLLTDGSGSVTLESVPSQGYQLRVSASGFRSRRIDVLDAATPSEVMLQPVGDVKLVRVIDSTSQAPIETGVTFLDDNGLLDCEYGGNGTWRILSDSEGSGWFSVRCDGYATVNFPQSLLRDESLRQPAYTLTLLPVVDIRIETESGAGVRHANLEVLELPIVLPEDVELDPPAWARSDSRTSPLGTALDVVTVPIGATIEVAVLDSESAYGVRRDTVAVGQPSFRVRTAPGEVLELRFRDEQGKNLEGVSVFVDRSSAGSRRSQFLLVDSRLELADPFHIRQLRVHAKGRQTLNFYPSGQPTERGGSLDVVMPPSWPVTILVRDERDEPVAGATIHGSATDGSVVSRSPNRTDRLPTNHPGWLCQTRPALNATTDAEGKVQTSLPSGRWQVQIDTSNSGSVVAAVSLNTWHTFHVSQAMTGEIVVPRARKLSLEVLDIAGRRIRDAAVEFRIIPNEAPQRRSLWGGQGILAVPESCASFTVTAPGFHSRIVNSRESPGPRLVVTLDSHSVGRLDLSGEMRDRLVGLRLQVQALDRSDHRARVLWSDFISIPSASDIPLDIPLDGPVTVRVLAPHEEFTIDPINDVWHRGGTVRFAVRRR